MGNARRLAFVIHDLNTKGGQDRSTLEIARRLSHRFGIDLYSFTLEDPKLENGWGDYRFHQIHPKIAHPVLVKSSLFYGVTYPILKWNKPLIQATGACSLIADIIQVQFVHAAWAEQRQKIQSVYHRLLNRFDLFMEKKVFTPDKTYIAISQSVADELKRHFGISHNVHVIHHGVDPLHFKPANDASQLSEIRAKWGLDENDFVISFVGSFSAQDDRKGLGVTIEAIAKMNPQKRKQIRLLVIGDGDQNHFKEVAEKLGVAENIVWVGRQSNVVPFYQVSQLFCLPTQYEPFGLVVLEAMACGVVPMVSRSAGAAELIEENKNGFLIDDPSSSQELAQKLDRVVDRRVEIKTISQAARSKAEEQSWDQVADRYAEIFDPLLKEAA